MFVSAPLVILAFTAMGRVVSETYKKGGKAVLSPGSVSDPITSITWKHGVDIAVEFYGQETTAYRNFKGRCELNITTGALTISNLSLNDSGSYTAEVNSRIMETTDIKVITAVPKPTISTHCNPELTHCTFTCDASITEDTGPISYSWKIGDRQNPSSGKQLNITKSDTESVGKLISCQLENPVSSERSDDIMSPFTNWSSEGVNTTAVTVWVVLVVLAVSIPVGIICWHKHRPQNADISWGQYFAWLKRTCLNCGRNRVTQTSTNGADLSVQETSQSTVVPTFHSPNTVPRFQYQAAPIEEQTVSEDNSSEAAASPENQAVTNQHQPGPEPQDNSSEAAASPENQAVTNQHQPGPEPQDNSSEAAETSAAATNAEETQQEDETAED